MFRGPKSVKLNRALRGRRRCPGRDRFLVVHPVNPPHLVPVVEIVPASRTSEQTVNIVKSQIYSVGQVPVVVRKEIDGSILNRLQGALLDEAWRLFEDGYASVADIEARLATLLETGRSLYEAAERLGVVRDTVRHQLKSNFSKMNVHRQSELIALLAKL